MAIRKSAPHSVRLTEIEMNEILNGVAEVAQHMNFQWEEISLFGSRTDLQKKGGDMDIYIRIKCPLSTNIRVITRALRQALTDRLGDRKIDLVLDDSVVDLGAFGELIKKSKVVLWTAQ